METRRTPQMSTQIILGLFVIAIGLLFILDNFGVMDAFQYINYWPALLVGFGLLKALQPAGSPGRGWGVVLIVIGLLLLLPRLDIVALRFRDIWPLILVLIGGSLI